MVGLPVSVHASPSHELTAARPNFPAPISGPPPVPAPMATHQPNITIINQNQTGGAGFHPALLDAANKSPGLALFLSFLFVGAGQLYNGQVGKGILMFFISIFLWVAFLGWIINIWSMIDAYSVAKDKRLKWLQLLSGQQQSPQIARLG